MSEPALDLSEIIELYKEDARRSVQQMQGALQRWDEVAGRGPACHQLRRLSHQLRGSGRTYGFRNVTRIGKAIEHLMIKLESQRLPANERLHKLLTGYIERLAVIFG